MDEQKEPTTPDQAEVEGHQRPRPAANEEPDEVEGHGMPKRPGDGEGQSRDRKHGPM